uniref:CG1503-PA n=1 Tax=Drosophila melanogaster TaxID=7227 RepID=B4F527_DROME|nr:CG1503-PA [Drosophila melanogaster]CAQ53277.1 CG1503-PA [Drosophila melanogaster]CAQ53278.1 CG1503-PA [Drosophila melanogaster]CAQ53282.1 CG1503-PA [Drosophila melanogaster]
MLAAKKVLKTKNQMEPLQDKKPRVKTKPNAKGKVKEKGTDKEKGKFKAKGNGKSKNKNKIRDSKTSTSLALERGSGDGPHQLAEVSLVALRFMDISLRHSDVQLLQSANEGVNERLVAFYYAYLQHRRYRSELDLHFLNPGLAARLRHMNMRQLWAMVRDRRLNEKQFILVPLSTHPRPHGHWSLLVISRPDSKFYHYDSLDNCHSPLAASVSETLRAPLEAWKFALVTGRCLQQERQAAGKEGSGRDPASGIHLMCMTDHVADYVARCGYATSSLLIAVDQIAAMRTHLVELIQSLGGILPSKRGH